MTIHDFIALPHKNQLDTIGDLGVFQYKRQEPGREVTTFRIDDFLVDVYFSIRALRITGPTIRSAPVEEKRTDENPKEPLSSPLRFPQLRTKRGRTV